MKILLTNDDGIKAEGLRILAERLHREHEIYVVAPESEKSGAGHSISFKSHITYKTADFPNTVQAFQIFGSPADCVKFAVNHIFKFKFDAVVSGINHGKNTGTDVIYSGTVAAAIEGCVAGIPSVAVSYGGGEGYDFGFAANFIAENIQKLLIRRDDGSPCVMSVNFPKCVGNLIAGVKTTKLGEQKYNDVYNEFSESGETRYKLAINSYINGENPRDCDVVWYGKRYITITPLHTDLTDRKTLTRIKGLQFKL